jgi:predicted PurR-regulated permease PerM
VEDVGRFPRYDPAVDGVNPEIPRSARGSNLHRLAALVIIFAGIKFAESVLVPFLLGTLIAIAAQPLSRVLEHRGVSKALATAITILIALAVIAGGTFLLVYAASELSEALPALQASLLQARHTIMQGLAERGLERMGAVLQDVSFAQGLPQTLTSGLLGAANVATRFILIIVITVFVLLEAASFQHKLRLAFGEPTSRQIDVSSAVRDVQRYLVLKTIVCVGTGAIVGVMVAAFGLRSPLFWGILAFVLNYIPFIGSAVAGAPAVLLAWVQLGTFEALLMAAGYLTINFAFGNILEPRLMGRTLGMSPLVVLLSVFTWGWLLGPVGALLSVPLTQMIKIGCSHTPDWEWLAVLMGNYRENRPPTEDGAETGSVAPRASESRV